MAPLPASNPERRHATASPQISAVLQRPGTKSKPLGVRTDPRGPRTGAGTTPRGAVPRPAPATGCGQLLPSFDRALWHAGHTVPDVCDVARRIKRRQRPRAVGPLGVPGGEV